MAKGIHSLVWLLVNHKPQVNSATFKFLPPPPPPAAATAAAAAVTDGTTLNLPRLSSSELTTARL